MKPTNGAMVVGVGSGAKTEFTPQVASTTDPKVDPKIEMLEKIATLEEKLKKSFNITKRLGEIVSGLLVTVTIIDGDI